MARQAPPHFRQLLNARGPMHGAGKAWRVAGPGSRARGRRERLPVAGAGSTSTFWLPKRCELTSTPPAGSIHPRAASRSRAPANRSAKSVSPLPLPDPSPPTRQSTSRRSRTRAKQSARWDSYHCSQRHLDHSRSGSPRRSVFAARGGARRMTASAPVGHAPTAVTGLRTQGLRTLLLEA